MSLEETKKTTKKVRIERITEYVTDIMNLTKNNDYVELRLTKNECNLVIKGNLTIQHIAKMLAKCDKEINLIRNTEYTDLDIVIFDPENRLEYLENPYGKLKFIMDYPEREQTV